MIADRSVGGIGFLAASVADAGAEHSREIPKLGIGVPESAESEGGGPKLFAQLSPWDLP